MGETRQGGDGDGGQAQPGPDEKAAQGVSPPEPAEGADNTPEPNEGSPRG